GSGPLVRHHEPDDARAVEEAHTVRLRMAAEVILEDAAIELVTGRREIAAGTELGDLVDLFGAFGKEEAETEFLQLLRREVLLQPEHRIEIMRPDLDGRLAHLVSGLGYRVAHALEHHDIELRESLPKLQSECEASEPTAHDDHISLEPRWNARLH